MDGQERLLATKDKLIYFKNNSFRMRVKFRKGVQRELLLSAKTCRKWTWRELANILRVNERTVRGWYGEEALIPAAVWQKLDPGKIYQTEIVEMKDEGWGRSRGGFHSRGNLKHAKKPKNSGRLAELVGIFFGDGNIYVNEKYGIYQIRIASSRRDEADYSTQFLKPLVSELFGIPPRIMTQNGGIYVCLDSREIAEYLRKKGVPWGGKSGQSVRIPPWINDNANYLESCLRGLLDTDGSVYKLSNKDPKLVRISFKNKNPALLNDVRQSFVRLNYNVSKVVGDNVFITRQADVRRYIKEIGFHNRKHVIRLGKIAP